MAGGFKYIRDLHGENHGILVPYIIANSQTITKGQAVKLSAGFIISAATTGRVLGIVQAFANSSGVPLNQPFLTLKGTYTAGDVGVESYAAASDNQTVDKVVAIVNTSPYAVYSVAPDATIATTTGSNLAGYYCYSIAAGTATAENSATAVSGSFFIHGVDPAVSTNQLVSIAEPQYLGHAAV